MYITDLIKKLKEAKVIRTLVGEFAFCKQIGEGGNSNVCLYKKNGIEFAVKFFSKGTENTSKAKRFIDEYFGMAQIPTHPNVADYLHMDTVTVNSENFLIIIMKLYKSTLKGTLENETEESVYIQKLRALYEDLLHAIEHLHAHGIVHRDIKPQNILIDRTTNRYVLSDFGISKFEPESIAKEAETRDGERLANYRYCAPEQRGNSVSANFASDLYSFAQVIQEYATGDINQGGGRTQLKFKSVEFIRIVDNVIARCLMHNPQERFNNVAELRSYMIAQSDEYKEEIRYLAREKEYSESWDFLHRFSRAIAEGFPRVKTTAEITDVTKMIRFFNFIDNTINNDTDKNNLWMIQSNGGDLNYYGATHISGNDFEINYGGYFYQIRIIKILFHYDASMPHKNFFIILGSSMPHFDYVDTTDLSKHKTREYYPETEDGAVIWNGKNLDPMDTENHFVEIEDNIYEYTSDSFKRISRFVAPEALLVSPTGVFSYAAHQNDHAENLLTNCLRDNALTSKSVQQYLNGMRGHYSSWISSRN